MGDKNAATFYTLQHCFTPRAWEIGVGLRVNQQHSGNKSLKTNETYTHATQKTLDEFRSPLDDYKKYREPLPEMYATGKGEVGCGYPPKIGLIGAIKRL